ncbi:MAG TPA: DUF742 domain-containing protein [Kineosporiaceae bacterium]
MSRWDDEPTDDEPLGRPYLTGVGARPDFAPRRHDDRAAPVTYEHHQGEVRPYLLTGGRTSPRGAAVAMETVVQATGLPLTRRPDAAGLERARILRLCDRPCSAAEVAARLHLPLQVALVLVTDLVAEGLLDATGVGLTQADDVLFLERLIAGVAAL